MATDWELEDWLMDAGDRAERAWLEGGDAALSPIERLVREVWLLDMETRNGGLSQYFANHELERWTALRAAWQACGIPSLRPIIEHVDALIAGADDPYEAALDASPDVEAFYEAHQPAVLAELRARC